MKKILFLMTIAIAATTLFACNGKDDKNDAENPYEVGFPSLVDMYYIPSSVKVKLVVADECDSTHFPYFAMDCGFNEGQAYWFNAKDESKMSGFVKYANFFGDTLGVVKHGIPHQQIASVMPLVSVDVTSDSDFDETHPAGSSLNNILSLYTYHDLGASIASKREKGVWCRDSIFVGLTAITETNPVNMLNDWFRIHFTKAPATPGAYKFTVSMKFGADPLTGETVDIEPVTVEIEFK